MPITIQRLQQQQRSRVCDGFIVLVLAVVVGQRDRVLRGHGRGRPPFTGAVDVLVEPTGPVLVPVRPVLWPRRRRGPAKTFSAHMSVLRWR